jgi:integrase
MAQYRRKLRRGYRWYYKFSYNSQIYFSKCIYLSKAEAKKAEAELFSKIEDNVKIQSNKILHLYDMITERLRYLEISKSDTHHYESKRYLKVFSQYFGDVDIKSISKSDINKFLLQKANDYKQQGITNYPINALIRVLKALFYYIIDTYELNMRNPCKGINFYPIDKKMKYIPTDNEINSLLDICDEQQKLLVEFVRDTGARINEAINLLGKDINDNYVILYTRKSNRGDRIPRKIPKPDCLKNKEYTFDERVFNRWTFTPVFLKRKIRILDGNEWNWHNLRHRYASLLSKEVKPIFEIMSLLGHNNLSTTQIYLQLL